MTKKRMRRWVTEIAVGVLSVLLIAAYVEAAEQQVIMTIEGMDCELCTVAIKKSLEGVKGVKTVKVSFNEKKAWLTVDQLVTDESLTTAVQNAGPYKGKVVERK